MLRAGIVKPAAIPADQHHVLIRLLALVAAVSTLFAEDFTGKVVGISDGDTIRVMRDGVAERVRLWGIDCPEAKRRSARGRSSSRGTWRWKT